MRKLWTAVVGAIVASIAVAGIALAENIYDVPKALVGASPHAKGSLKKPVPAKLKFGFTVGDTENLRPEVVREYRIAAEGLQSYPDARPTCTWEQANKPIKIDSACNKAIVGKGTIDNLAGAAPIDPVTGKPDRTAKVPCAVKLTQINISNGDPRYPKTVSQIRKQGGMAIRIDTDPPACPIPIHQALAAPFYDVKLEGISTAELRFTVPDGLAHPGTLANAVVKVTTTIDKKKGKVKVKGKKRTVGFYSLVGRKGKTRTTRVTFIDESGVKKTATQKK
jgi:hypothetical protein